MENDGDGAEFAIAELVVRRHTSLGYERLTIIHDPMGLMKLKVAFIYTNQIMSPVVVLNDTDAI